ncbi:hypothetical protein AGMMS50239_34340 [Bacteroidia bacterium]|nr:hypothetical protein AGMMS50239_34340 [Bacteroidia bacterium]
MDLLSLFSPLALVTNYPQLVLNTIPGNSQVKIEMNVDALKNQSASRVYKGKVYIRKKILWLVSVNINIEDKTVNSTSSMLPIDGAPGGRYSLDMLGGDLPIPDSDIKQSTFCFVPTVSSLALSDWSTTLTQNLSNVTTSPFYSIFTQGANELHTRFNSSASFLYNHLYPFNQDVYIQNETITSNRLIEGKNIYVGRAVTATKPQGNVLITNNAQIIFKVAENVFFEAGFESTLGATFEVIKH